MIDLPILDADEGAQEQPKQRFWRSLAQWEQNPEAEELAQEEFMPGASDPPGGATRRQFLQLMGASMAMCGLAACRRPTEHILPYTRNPEEIIEGIGLSYATAMPFRGHLRGLLVESHEGRPTKIEGNPEHDNTQGKTSPFEQASILNLYDPFRSNAVRRGRETATWGEFVSAMQSIHADAGNRSLAVLCEETSSMTVAGLRQQLEQLYPDFRWVTYNSQGGDLVSEGYEQAFGSPVRPLFQFSEAQVIVSLDADFLDPIAPNMVRDTREWAASRRLEDPEDAMSRMYMVESQYSVTGSQADHRLRLRSSDIPGVAAAIAAQLGVGGGNAQAEEFADHAFVQAMVEDLQEAGANGVVVAGETQPAEVHALCAAINSALGSVGTTVELLEPGEEFVPARMDEFEALVSDMHDGDVDVLLIIGCNPVYDAPADLDFVGALGEVGNSIHLDVLVSETARACDWHVPRTHYLEAWGDGRSYEGTMSVIQPLIAPLYDAAHSEIEVLNLLVTGRDQAGYDLVRNQWSELVEGDFEQGWRRVLHDGFLPETAFATVTAEAGAVTLNDASPVEEGDLEVVFRLDPTVLDGRFANNAWLQELPHPTTKLVWDNVAIMSPATAQELDVQVRYRRGVFEADVISISIGERSVQIPAWIMPGHADGSITVNLGYGQDILSRRERRRTPIWDTDDYTDIYGQGEAIATGVGTNVGAIRTVDTMTVATGVQVERTNDTYTLVSTQEHGAIEQGRRPIYRLGSLDEYRENPDFAWDMEPYVPGEQRPFPALYEEDLPHHDARKRDTRHYRNQWGMVIDLNTCTGCSACVVACQSENNVQVVGKEEVGWGREMHWLRIDRYFMSPTLREEDIPQDPEMVMQPMLCQHCDKAPCEPVCPVAATYQSPDGTNQMVYNRCIGTRYCSNNCPYKVRRFNFYGWTKTLPIEVQMAQNPRVTVRSRGIMEKCTFCVQRFREAQERATLETRSIADGEVQTACQQACPADAIVFGDLNDPNSRVNQLRQDRRRFEVLAEYNTRPRVSYIAHVKNKNQQLDEANQQPA